ncbi:hypothetical protein ACWEJ6_11705 [Nonomuraea sp. NPDC004702]
MAGYRRGTIKNTRPGGHRDAAWNSSSYAIPSAQTFNGPKPPGRVTTQGLRIRINEIPSGVTKSDGQHTRATIGWPSPSASLPLFRGS